MGFAATVLTALSCAFYLYVLVQFRREQMRSKRKPGSLTFVGSSGEPTVPFPMKHEERPRAERNSQGKHKLVPISQRPVVKAAEKALQTTRNSDRLPYVEMNLPIAGVATLVTTARDKSH
jgi:hypothetical protein